MRQSSHARVNSSRRRKYGGGSFRGCGKYLAFVRLVAAHARYRATLGGAGAGAGGEHLSTTQLGVRVREQRRQLLQRVLAVAGKQGCREEAGTWAAASLSSTRCTCAV